MSYKQGPSIGYRSSCRECHRSKQLASYHRKKSKISISSTEVLESFNGIVCRPNELRSTEDLRICVSPNGELYKLSGDECVKIANYDGPLKPSIGVRGYEVVHINGKISYVHRLVAECFLNHKRCGFELVVNHIDFNKTNNKLDNLEIVTNRENSNKKHLKSSSKYIGVYWSGLNNKWRASISINSRNKHLGLFTDELEASKAYQKELLNIS